MPLLKGKLAGQVGARYHHHSLSSSSRDNSRISMSPAVFSSSSKLEDLATPWLPGILRHLDTKVEVRAGCKVSGVGYDPIVVALWSHLVRIMKFAQPSLGRQSLNLLRVCILRLIRAFIYKSQ